jgi:hypothetical protein
MRDELSGSSQNMPNLRYGASELSKKMRDEMFEAANSTNDE